jgi:L-threonylcarbamoyladenylate synthase
LQRGEIVAFPTDTVYGLGAHAFRPDAIARLYALKRRPSGLAIPLLLSGEEMLEVVCEHIPGEASLLAEQFWPGGLSLVLTASETIQGILTAGGPTVAVRVPAHHDVRQLCRLLGSPLAATSANLHGEPESRTADDVLLSFAGRIPYLLDGGACRGGIASTVIDLTRQPARVLREGPVTRAELAQCVLLGE